MFYYRVGFPGWKIAAKLGVTLRVRVEVMHDPEAGVFIATSPDLRGLVVETDSFEALPNEIKYCIDALLHETFEREVRSSPVIHQELLGDNVS